MFYKINLLYYIWMLNDITNCMNETKSLTNLPHQQNNNVKYCRLGSTSTLIKQTFFIYKAFNTFWNYYCFVFRINLPWCCHMKTHKFFQNVQYACVHLTWLFHFILIMQIGEILHNTKCFWIALDKPCPNFIPILFFAHESNVPKCFLESIITHLLHYFISILQIEELLHNTKCFWETFDKSCPSFLLGEQNQLTRKKKLELKVEWKMNNFK